MNFVQTVNKNIKSSKEEGCNPFIKDVIFSTNYFYVREIKKGELTEYALGDIPFAIYSSNNKPVNNETYLLKNAKVFIKSNSSWTKTDASYIADHFYLNQLHPHTSSVEHLHPKYKIYKSYRLCLGGNNAVEITNLLRNKKYEDTAYSLVDVLGKANTINPYINVSYYNYSWNNIAQCSYCKRAINKNGSYEKDEHENIMCNNCVGLTLYIKDFMFTPSTIKYCSECGYYKMKIRKCRKCSRENG